MYYNITKMQVYSITGSYFTGSTIICETIYTTAIDVKSARANIIGAWKGTVSSVPQTGCLMTLYSGGIPCQYIRYNNEKSEDCNYEQFITRAPLTIEKNLPIFAYAGGKQFVIYSHVIKNYELCFT